MRRLSLITLASLSLAGCVGQQEVAVTEPTMSGKERYEALCASCHGVTGRGDGPAANGLTRRPADLTALAARNGGTFPIIAVMSRIDGYTSETGTMPEFGRSLDGPLVPFETEPGVFTPTPPELIALAEYVETLQR